jgi:uncharacterized protein (DUF1800 family)
LLAVPGPSTWNTVQVNNRWLAGLKSGGPMSGGYSELFSKEMTASLQYAVTTDIPFRERLVWFWANHFTVAARGGPWPFGLNGAYVQEAIRPNVSGTFADLALAVMRHPAMLDYLDENRSVGPDSPTGKAKQLGLNENLAREFLELHTLGVNGGYTQRDVTAFALLLTGRRFEDTADNLKVVFHPDMSEPGPETIMGHTFGDGLAGSEAAIVWIANHPATHRHLATQLVRHFVADVPPASCVARVSAALNESGGDLKAAYRAIIEMPEAWQPMTKFLAPVDYIIAVQRALALPFEPGSKLLEATADLGQPFRNPLLPNGWPDTADDWIAGEGLLKRADYAMSQAIRPGAPDAQAVLEATIGDICSDTTRAAVKACPDNAEALATVLASPEFMRR